MSLDFSSILQQEIAKKQKQLSAAKERANLESVKKNTEPTNDSPVTFPDNVADIEADSEETKEDEVKKKDDRLVSRATRIDEILSKEAEVSNEIQVDEIMKDNDSLAIKCNFYIHSILNEWSTNVDSYRNGDHALFTDTKKNLFPLLVKLRKNTLPNKLLVTLSSILYHLQRGTKEDIQSSLQLYLKLSIGDVAWPIGVSDVGIHSRSAQHKISRFGNTEVANIMIDETTRLWIICIKRLITFKEWVIKANKN